MTTHAAALAEGLIAEVRAAGGKIWRDGAFIELAAHGPLPQVLIERLRAAKPELLAAFADPAEIAEWRARHAVALAHWRALHPEPEARSLAWGELQARWHRLHGARAPEWQCAGCDAPIGDSSALTLADGNRVHFDEKNVCLIAFGRRWRGNAVTGLRALGLEPSEGLVCDDN